MKNYRIAVYAQHCNQAGKICNDEDMIESESDDLIIFSGSKGYILGIAKAKCAFPYSAETAFSHKVSDSLFEYMENC